MKQAMHVPILTRATISENTVEVVFGISERNFEFKAGQYVSVALLELENKSITDRFHDFSIVSSPNNKDIIAIAFRGSTSVFKTALLHLPLGSTVLLEGPKGVFTLPDSFELPLVFVAGGIGVAPFLSMIRFITENNLLCRITLLYANQTREDAAYLSSLEEYSRQNKFISIQNIEGFFEEKYLMPFVSAVQKSLYFVAGPPDMVSSVVKCLRDYGIMSTHIRTEEFAGYQ